MAFALEHFPIFPYPPSGMQEVEEIERYLTGLHRSMQEFFSLLPRDIYDGISVVELDDLANTELADPNADRIVFWDDGAGYYTWLSPDGTSLEISGAVLQVVADGIDDTHIDWGTGANQVSAVDVPIADAGSHYTGTEVETALQEAMTELKVHQLTGFEDASSVALSTDSGNPPTITLTFTGTAYWWSDGVRYSDSGTDALQMADSSGVYWIYYDGATLSAQVNPSDAELEAIITDKASVCIVYFNATTNASYVVANELHGVEMSGETHRWLHENIGSRYHGGLTISGYTLDTATNAALTFEVTDGSFYDEDLLVAISDGTAANQYEQQLSGGDASIPVLYRNAGGEWTEQAASTLPYIVSGTTLRYMDADNSYTQTSLGNNQYMNMFLVATNDWQYPIKMIQGTDEYSQIDYVQGAAAAERVDWGTLPSAEWILLYQIILKQASGESVDGKIVDIIDYRFAGITGSSATSQDHGSLSGLGDDDHAQYLLTDGSRPLSSDWDAGTARAIRQKTVQIYDAGADNYLQIEVTTDMGANNYWNIVYPTDTNYDWSIDGDFQVTGSSFINQDVRTTASPTLADLTLDSPSNIYALSHDSFADFDAAKHFIEGSIDHGSIAGLDDDDHGAVYYTEDEINADGFFEADGNGDMQPITGTDAFDWCYELDGNDDIQPNDRAFDHDGSGDITLIRQV